jgi:hypothetical protein
MRTNYLRELANINRFCLKSKPFGQVSRFSLWTALNPNARTPAWTNNSPDAKVPLIENYRPTWPDFDYQTPSDPHPLLERTVPDNKLSFKMKATFAPGSLIFYPHLKINPADLKVRMRVSFNHLIFIFIYPFSIVLH